ncbi:hypothetical protein BKA63DRAFT_561065 [Paraphoma chrysanthemicola]|nr:hypothetical protein BKA63DRAFT_561065 [Paraphoma chrysanthemicola]
MTTTNISSPASDIDRLPASRPKNSLLSLPGELRNKIYALCVEERRIKLRKDYWGSRQAGFFRSLTQVCRQLREEFRALYLQATTFEMRLCGQHEDYFRTFYSSTNTEYMKQHRGNVVLRHSYDSMYRVPIHASIGHVLHLAASSPNLNCKIDCIKIEDGRLETSIAQLNSFLACIKDEFDPTWRNLVFTAINKVQFYSNGTFCKLTFLIQTFEDAKQYRKIIYTWWDRVAKPYRGIPEVVVSWFEGTCGYYASQLLREGALLNPQELPEYIDTFYPEAEDHIMATYSGEIIIREKGYRYTVDLYRLFKLIIKCPFMRFQMLDDYDDWHVSPLYVLGCAIKAMADPTNVLWRDIMRQTWKIAYQGGDGSWDGRACLTFHTSQVVIENAEWWWDDTNMPDLSHHIQVRFTTGQQYGEGKNDYLLNYYCFQG